MLEALPDGVSQGPDRGVAAGAMAWRRFGFQFGRWRLTNCVIPMFTHMSIDRAGVAVGYRDKVGMDGTLVKPCGIV